MAALLRGIHGAAQVATRILSLVGRELVETVRRPGALVSLVFGPFLVMALFGVGYSGYRRPLQTLVVVPPDSGLTTDVQAYRDVAGPGLEIVSVSDSVAGSQQQLRDGKLDVVAIAPSHAAERFRNGEQSRILIRIHETDPVQAAYAGFIANSFADSVNREIIRQAAAEADQQAIQQGRPDLARIPPEVLSAPVRAEVQNTVPLDPTVVGFFGPAVLALILQHMGVTLIALSVVRERTTGVIELFRVSPISAWEVVVGKVLGFGFLSGILGTISVILLLVLGVPLLGHPLTLAAVLGLLVLASLGVGLLIALISDSERQAVQLSLLVLLASVFFSGFVLPISEFSEPVRSLAYILPVTHGIRLSQEVMLLGTVIDTWQLGALAVIAVVLLLACWLLLRRGMRTA